MELCNSIMLKSSIFPHLLLPPFLRSSSVPAHPFPRLDNFLSLISSNLNQYTCYLNHSSKKNLTPHLQPCQHPFTEKGAAFDLSCEVHMTTILTIRLVKAKLWKGMFPCPSEASICPHILPFLPRKEQAIVKHYKGD